MTEIQVRDFLDVRAFHVKFGQPVDDVTRPIDKMPNDQFLFRKRFLFEEADEYAVAYNKRQLVQAVDSLLDLVYVVYGTVLFMGAGMNYYPRMSWPYFTKVRGFLEAQGALAGCPGQPHLLPQAMHEIMHHSLMNELKLFSMSHDMQELNAVPLCLSGLWDIAWKAYTIAAMMSVPWDRCWGHVQAANMAKVRALPDGSNSRRQSGWDVVKPEGWEPPDGKIKFELVMAGADVGP